jgi:hypothetical protein
MQSQTIAHAPLALSFHRAATNHLRVSLSTLADAAHFRVTTYLNPPLKSNMARGCAKQKKHYLLNDLKDLVLQPKNAPPLRPIAWDDDDDDELGSIFAAEYDFAEEELQRRRDEHQLYHQESRENLLRERQFDLPSPFLQLPAELQVQIYRYILICSKPIDLGIEVLRINNEERLAISLLRVSKQMHCETCQVLYGDNTFRFLKDSSCFSITYALPRNAFYWLKEITFSVPLSGGYQYWGEDYVAPPSPCPNLVDTPKCGYCLN